MHKISISSPPGSESVQSPQKLKNLFFFLYPTMDVDWIPATQITINSGSAQSNWGYLTCCKIYNTLPEIQHQHTLLSWPLSFHHWQLLRVSKLSAPPFKKKKLSAPIYSATKTILESQWQYHQNRHVNVEKINLPCTFLDTEQKDPSSWRGH